MEDLGLLPYREREGDEGSDELALNGTTTGVAAVEAVEPVEEDGDDDGPFFDLEFAAASDEDGGGGGGEEDDIDVSSGDDDGEEESLVLDGTEAANAKNQFPVSLLKSATKFRVLVLRLKKSKSTAPGKSDSNSSTSSSAKSQEPAETRSSQNDKEQSKFSTVKYLKMIKPLYVRTSKRYSERVRLSGMLSSSPTASAAVAACKRLGKSRSASSATVPAPEPAATAAAASKRRDDWLSEQQDGIQSAILHCKRSFNGSTDLPNGHFSRSSSHRSDKQSMDLSRNSSGELVKEAPSG